MKKYLFFIILILSQMAQAMDLKATVNDVPISNLDVKNWVRLLKFQQPQKYEGMSDKELQKAALTAAIESAVKKQTTNAVGLKATQNDIAQARAHLEAQNGLAAGALPEVLRQNNVPASVLNAQIESDLLWIQYVQKNAPPVSVSELAVNKRYQSMKDALKKQGIEGSSISLWEMAQGLFPENVNVSTTLESKSCDAFLEHIKIGPYPQSAQRGWTDPLQMPIELREILKDVAVGETLGPLRTPDGLLVMMKCNVRTQQVLPSKEDLKLQMEMEQMEVVSRRLLAEAMRRAIIERKD